MHARSADACELPGKGEQVSRARLPCRRNGQGSPQCSRCLTGAEQVMHARSADACELPCKGEQVSRARLLVVLTHVSERRYPARVSKVSK